MGVKGANLNGNNRPLSAEARLASQLGANQQQAIRAVAQADAQERRDYLTEKQLAFRRQQEQFNQLMQSHELGRRRKQDALLQGQREKDTAFREEQAELRQENFNRQQFLRERQFQHRQDQDAKMLQLHQAKAVGSSKELKARRAAIEKMEQEQNQLVEKMRELHAPYREVDPDFENTFHKAVSAQSQEEFLSHAMDDFQFNGNIQQGGVFFPREEMKKQGVKIEGQNGVLALFQAGANIRDDSKMTGVIGRSVTADRVEFYGYAQRYLELESMKNAGVVDFKSFQFEEESPARDFFEKKLSDGSFVDGSSYEETLQEIEQIGEIDFLEKASSDRERKAKERFLRLLNSDVPATPSSSHSPNLNPPVTKPADLLNR